MMFTVFEKGVWEEDNCAHDNRLKSVEVYAVRDDNNGYPHFLICENGEWKYRSAQYYTNDPKQYVWYDREKWPEVYKSIIVRDTDGREYDNHHWDGHVYYRYVETEEGRRYRWRSGINIVEWRYKA